MTNRQATIAGLALAVLSLGAGVYFPLHSQLAEARAAVAAQNKAAVDQAKADQAAHDEMVRWMRTMQSQILFIKEVALPKHDKAVFKQAYMAVLHQQAQPPYMPEVQQPVLAQRQYAVHPTGGAGLVECIGKHPGNLELCGITAADAPAAQKPKEAPPQ